MKNFLKGRIIKKNNKRILVFIKRIFFLKKYKKKIFYFSRIWALDMFNESNLGDFIMIKKSRPLTKMLFWILSKIIEKIRIL